MGEHHDSPLAKAALCMAAAVRGGDVAGVIFHSDKGGEYVGDLFAEACAALGVTQSMGRVGSALDNAAAESFNSTLERELLSRRHFATSDQARREVARFIDPYNHRRRHSAARCSHPSPTSSSSPTEPPNRRTGPPGPRDTGLPDPGTRLEAIQGTTPWKLTGFHIISVRHDFRASQKSTTLRGSIDHQRHGITLELVGERTPLSSPALAPSLTWLPPNRGDRSGGT